MASRALSLEPETYPIADEEVPIRCERRTRPFPSESLVGRTLCNRYRVLRTLHRSAAGVVYRAEHVRLGREVAIKTLVPDKFQDANARLRFEREAGILSRLRHPHVVEALDYDRLPDGSPFLVMELLPGENLSNRLAKHGKLPLDEVLRLVGEIVSALSAVHEAGIVHRDLKPGNIFLMRVPHRPPFVKLIDFGVSYELAGRSPTRPERELLGTPYYMAPEQALLHAIDERTDQYSLAVLIWEALTGKRPFQKRHLMPLLHEIVTSSPSWMDFDPVTLPHDVETVLRKALSKDPEARYRSVAEFGADLAAAASAPPPQSDTASDAEHDVRLALEMAGREFEAGSFEAAADHVESALRTAEQSGDRCARSRAVSASDLIDRVFRARLGNLAAHLDVIRVPDPSDPVMVSPDEAYLISRIDGVPTLEDVLDLAPMPARNALRLLIGLLRKGMVRLA